MHLLALRMVGGSAYHALDAVSHVEKHVGWAGKHILGKHGGDHVIVTANPLLLLNCKGRWKGAKRRRVRTEGCVRRGGGAGTAANRDGKKSRYKDRQTDGRADRQTNRWI